MNDEYPDPPPIKKQEKATPLLAEHQPEEDDFIKKNSGKTLQQWEAVWRERRINGVADGDLRLDKVYSDHEARRIVRLYGLEADDLVLCDNVPTGKIERDNPGYRAPIHAGVFASSAMAYMLNPDKFPNA